MLVRECIGTILMFATTMIYEVSYCVRVTLHMKTRGKRNMRYLQKNLQLGPIIII